LIEDAATVNINRINQREREGDRESEKRDMQIFFYLFVLFFHLTNQLKCIRLCQNRQLKYNETLPNMTSYKDSDSRRCHTKQPKRCQGRFMIHYEDNFRFNSISYTFNRTTHIVDDEIEQLANQYRSKFFIYFLLAFQSIKKQFILTVYVLCQTYDECAYDTIKQLISSYKFSSDLFSTFDDIISSNQKRWRIFCKNFQTNSIEQCELSQNEKCFYEKFNRYERSSCLQSTFEQFEYEFFFTNKTIYKRRESFICNTDYCTNETVRRDIEDELFSVILKDFGSYTLFNHSNRYKRREQKAAFRLILFCSESLNRCILIMSYILMILKMIFEKS